MVDKEQKIIAEDAPLFEHIWKTGKGFYITFSTNWGATKNVLNYVNILK